MKIEFDFTEKKILVRGEVSLPEFIEKINTFLPDKDGWKVEFETKVEKDYYPLPMQPNIPQNPSPIWPYSPYRPNTAPDWTWRPFEQPYCGEYNPDITQIYWV